MKKKNYLVIDGKEIELSEETITELKSKLSINKLTYEDVAKSLFEDKKSYYINNDGEIDSIKNLISKTKDPNNSTTKEQLESILALNKLCNVAKYLNGGWMPDKDNSPTSIFVNYINDKLMVGYTSIGHSNVHFKNKELALLAIEILGEEEIRKALTLNH
jgi:hypothetical protein